MEITMADSVIAIIGFWITVICCCLHTSGVSEESVTLYAWAIAGYAMLVIGVTSLALKAL